MIESGFAMNHKIAHAIFAVLRFFDAHSGAIQALTAIVIAGLTGFLIYWTWRYAQSNSEILLVMKRDLEFRTTPVLRMSFETIPDTGHQSYGAMDFAIMNEGPAAAIVSAFKIEARCNTSLSPISLDFKDDKLNRTPYPLNAGATNTGRIHLAKKAEGENHPGDCAIVYSVEVRYENILRTKSWKLVSPWEGDDYTSEENSPQISGAAK